MAHVAQADGAADAPRRRLARHALLAAPLLLVLFVLYRAPAAFVWKAWLHDPYYTHGALAAAVAVALGAWRLLRQPRGWGGGLGRGRSQSRTGRADAPGGGRVLSSQQDMPAWWLAGVPVAGLLYAAGFLRHSPYLMAWSALAFAAALALATGGPMRVRRLAMPLLLGALALPTPWTLALGLRLQDLATAMSTAALGLGGVAYSQDLYTLRVGDLAFEVTPACSGFQGAVSLLTVGALVAAVFPLAPARKRLVLASAVPLALLLNAARIVAVVLVGLKWGPGAAEGFFHGASSLLLFLVETLGLLALAGVLRRAREVAAPA